MILLCKEDGPEDWTESKETSATFQSAQSSAGTRTANNDTADRHRAGLPSRFRRGPDRMSGPAESREKGHLRQRTTVTHSAQQVTDASP